MKTEERISTVVRDGLVLDVLDDGPYDGEPVVLLHGWPERPTVWRHVAPILNSAGYRTLAMNDVALSRWGAEHSGDWVDGPFELVVLDGASHWVPTQAPDLLADAILERVRG